MSRVVKTIVCGDTAVGKTTLLTRFSDSVYSNKMAETIGVNFVVRTLDGIKFQFTDCAGHLRFRAAVKEYTKGALVFIFCFNVKDRTSFEHIEREWIKDMSFDHAKTIGFLIGLRAHSQKKRQVPAAEAQAFAAKTGMKEYFEVSAKTGANVRETFQAIAKHAAAATPTYELVELPASERENDPFLLDHDEDQSCCWRGCC